MKRSAAGVGAVSARLRKPGRAGYHVKIDRKLDQFAGNNVVGYDATRYGLDRVIHAQIGPSKRGRDRFNNIIELRDAAIGQQGIDCRPDDGILLWKQRRIADRSQWRPQP